MFILQDFALVDVLFQVILRPAYLVQLLSHQFDHMKMVEDMHGVRAVPPRYGPVRTRGNHRLGQR